MTPAPTSQDIAGAWRSAEQQAMSDLGARRSKIDRYEFHLDDTGERLGNISLPKRPAPAPEIMVTLSPVTFSITYLPVEELVHGLKEPEREKDIDVTVSGRRRRALPESIDRSLEYISVGDITQINEAVELEIRAVSDYILPWMRTNATSDSILAYLSQPSANPTTTAYRLERRAGMKYLAGEFDESLTILAEYENRCCSTGIDAVDEPRRRFSSELRKKVTEER